MWRVKRLHKIRGYVRAPGKLIIRCLSSFRFARADSPRARRQIKKKKKENASPTPFSHSFISTLLDLRYFCPFCSSPGKLESNTFFRFSPSASAVARTKNKRRRILTSSPPYPWKIVNLQRGTFSTIIAAG